MANKVIAIILAILAKIYKKITTKKFQQNMDGFVQKINHQSLDLINHFKIKTKTKTKTQPPKTTSKVSFKKLFEPIKNFRDTISKFLVWVRNINFQSINPQKLLSTISSNLKQQTKPLQIKIKHFYSSLSPNTVLVITLSCFFLILIILGIVKSSRTIYLGVMTGQDNQHMHQNKIVPKYRESYFRRILPALQVDIFEVTMPIYVGSVNSVRTLLLDITLVTSNRFTRQFIDDNTGLVKDRLNNNMHPIIPDFPLTKEGKTIIREKVIFEINELLKEKKIEGEIKDVYFQMIIVA